jgi:hypothetical protein
MRRKYCFDVSSRTYVNYYVNQADSGLPIFRGSRGQREHGVGSVLGGLFRSALTVLKRVGSQALRTGARIASDMASGKKFCDVALQRISEGISKENRTSKAKKICCSEKKEKSVKTAKDGAVIYSINNVFHR